MTIEQQHNNRPSPIPLGNFILYNDKISDVLIMIKEQFDKDNAPMALHYRTNYVSKYNSLLMLYHFKIVLHSHAMSDILINTAEKLVREMNNIGLPKEILDIMSLDISQALLSDEQIRNWDWL